MNKALVAESVDKVRGRNLRLAVLGSGYVGLPTAALFADAGFSVTALDIRPEVVGMVNQGTSTITEPGLQELVSRNVRAGRLRATSDIAEALSKSGAVIVSVQTPIDEDRKPNMLFLTRALDDIGRALRKGMLVIIASTVPPRTMLGSVKGKLESASGLAADLDFYLAYVPERVAPGNAIKEFVESPRLVGGVGPDSTMVIAEFFRAVSRNVIETDALAAEVAKLAENTFRDVNIGFANELALICEQLGADIMEVIRLANTHPRVNIHLPGPGVGGPCLPKDPYLLLYPTKALDDGIISTARKMNDHMPGHIVDLVLRALKDAGKTTKDRKISVLGTAYKRDVDDSRLSPSEPVVRKLMQLGFRVSVYDPLSEQTFGGERATSLKEAIRSSDCMIVMTDHTSFLNLDLKELKELMNDKPAIVDGKRIIDLSSAHRMGFICYGIGFSKSED